jgi:hypothetical protein
MNRSTPTLLYWILLLLLSAIVLLSSEARGDEGVYRTLSREVNCPDGTCPLIPGRPTYAIQQGSAVAISQKDGYGWFVTTSHVIKKEPVIILDGKTYPLILVGDWYNASLKESVYLVRTTSRIPSNTIFTFDISSEPLQKGDSASLIGYPGGKYVALRVTVENVLKAGYDTSGELGYPGISGGGLIFNRLLYGIVVYIDRNRSLNTHHDITLIRHRIADEHPGVLPGTDNVPPIPSPANPQDNRQDARPQEPPLPHPSHPDVLDRDSPGTPDKPGSVVPPPGSNLPSTPETPLPVNPPTPIIPPAQVTPPRYRPFVPPPEPWPDQPLVIPPENQQPAPPRNDNRVLPWIRERASEVPWMDIGTLVLLGATGAGGGLLGWKGLMAGGRLLSGLMKSRPRPPTQPESTSQSAVFIPSSSEAKTENRFIIKEVDFMGEAYKEALRRTSTIEPRAIDVLKQVEHVAQEIIRGRNVSDRPKKSPQSGIWSDPQE